MISNLFFKFILAALCVGGNVNAIDELPRHKFEPNRTKTASSLIAESDQKDCTSALNYKCFIEDYNSSFDFILHNYTFYEYQVFDRFFYLADVFAPGKCDGETVGIKLIINPTEYDGLPDKIMEKRPSYILERNQEAENGFVSLYSIVPSSFAEKIIKSANHFAEGDGTFNRIVTSFNAPISFLQRSALRTKDAGDIKKKRSALRPNTSLQTNSQAKLDYYLKTRDINSGSIIRNFARGDEALPNTVHYFCDAEITSIIPRAFFRSAGVRDQLGSEWGYYLNTVPMPDGINFTTSLLLYDLVNIRAYDDTADQLQIRIVEHRNYRYNTIDDVIIPFGDNNLCLGNPILESDIRYVDFTDNLRSVHHPNPGDTDYVSANDHGFAFSGIDVKHIGSGKTSDSSIGFAKEVVCFCASALAATASYYLHLPLSASIAVGEAVSLATNSIFDSLSPSQYDVSRQGNIFESHIMDDCDNFSTAALLGKLQKSTYLRMPSYSGNDQNTPITKIANNRQTPLLLKTANDSFNFRHKIASSELADDYTATIEHKLSLDVFSDDSVWLFKWDPTFLKQTSGSWAYAIGKNVEIAPINIGSGREPVFGVCGTDCDQTFLFTPTKTANYNLVLTNAAPNCRLSVVGLPQMNMETHQQTFTNIWAGASYGAGSLMQCSYRAKVFLEAETQYTIRLSRLTGGKPSFGTAQLNIYEETENTQTISGSSEENSSLGRINQTIEYKGKAHINSIYVPNKGLLSFALCGRSSGSTDTYIQILDDSFRPIVEDDDGMGGFQAGAVLPVAANTTLHVISSLYRSSNADLLQLNIFSGEMLPRCDENTNGVAGQLLIDLGKQNSGFLFSVSSPKNAVFNFDRILAPIAKIYLRDANNTVLAENGKGELEVHLDAKKLYVIEVLQIRHVNEKKVITWRYL